MKVVDDYYQVSYAVVDGKAYASGHYGQRGLIEILSRIKGYPVDGILPRAFAGCGSLKQVWIQGGVKEIGEGAFANCTQLYELKIPASVNKIGDNAIPNIGPIELPDPYSHAELSNDPWARKQLGLYDPYYEPEYIQGYVTTVTAPAGSYAYRYCWNHKLKFKAE